MPQDPLLEGEGLWPLLLTTSVILPTTAKHFDRAGDIPLFINMLYHIPTFIEKEEINTLSY